MFANRPIAIVLLTAITLTFASGCPFRKERITVRPDGSVRMHLEYESPNEDFPEFAALPSTETGWRVTRRVEQEENKDEKRYVIEAAQTFGPADALPESLAAPADPDADLTLRFPTSLTIDERPDGTYYTLRRVYTPRRWAYVQYWHDTYIDDQIKKLGEKPVEELTRNEKEQIVGALAAVEAFKQIELAKRALETCGPDLPPELGLKARQALLSLYENEYDHFSVVLEACEPFQEDQQDKCFERQVDTIMQHGYATYVQSLRDSGLSPQDARCFDMAFDRERRYYEITNKLGGHGFEIDVEMPGEIVAHNAEKERTDKNDRISHLTWQFDGKAFRDRSFEIIVVSRVENGAPDKRTQVHDDNR